LRLIDVRIDDDFETDPRLLPGSVRVRFDDLDGLTRAAAGREAVVICQRGLKLSEGSAALIRLAGGRARVMDGGFEAWRAAGLPMVPVTRLPGCGPHEAMLWVTRERPKIDRVACPWLIRRFVDPDARFLFVAADQTMAVAEKFGATPFDVEGAFWSHRGDRCTFDVMVQEFGLATPALLRLAGIVRGADTAQLDLEPQSAGLLALSLGLSRLFADDLAQLDAGMMLYDALYLWCRDGAGETHNWPAAGALP